MEKKGLLNSVTGFLSTVWHLPEILHARKEQQKRDSAEAWRIARERGWTSYLGTRAFEPRELSRVNERAILIAEKTGTLPIFNDTLCKPLGTLVVIPGAPNHFVEVSRRQRPVASRGDSATQER